MLITIRRADPDLVLNPGGKSNRAGMKVWERERTELDETGIDEIWGGVACVACGLPRKVERMNDEQRHKSSA